MDNKYNIDEIENFLNQEMNEADLTAFEQRMETEEDLKEEVDFHATIVEGIKHSAELDFRALVGSTREGMLQEASDKAKVVDMKPQARMRSLGRSRVLALAASVALFLVAGWWLFLNPTSPERMYANNFEMPQDMLSAEVESRLGEVGFGTNVAALEDLQTAMQSYQNDDFETAKQQLGVFQTTYPSSGFVDKATYYEALSAMETEDYELAKRKLSVLVQNPAFDAQEDAKWYLALNNLNTGNIETAKSLLEELKTTTKYGAAAKHLLRKL